MNATCDKPLSGVRILIVEDDAILAFDMLCFLKGAGAETIGPASSLKRALALSQDEPLSCAVLDVRLRDEFVFPAARALREKHAGIVFYTGHADIDGLKRDWPEAQVLSKPSPSRSLLEAIGTACATVRNIPLSPMPSISTLLAPDVIPGA